MRKLLSVFLIALATSASAGTEHQGVLLEFSATSCGPCRQMSPLVSRLQRQGYPIRKVDVDRDPELARRYRISRIPAFVLIVDGEEVTRRVGLQSEQTLKRLMAEIPRSEPNRDEMSPASHSNRGSGQPPRPQSAAAENERHRSEGSGLSRFQLPLSEPQRGTRREAPPARQQDQQPIIRANYERDDKPQQGGPRIDPLAASTRVRIRDREGYSFGSGTIIDSRPGRTLVLTCGHIFRSFREDALVEVDVFHQGRSEKYVGKPVDYDLEADVGLIEIPTETALPFAEVAGGEYAVDRNQRVFSIGCGGGQPPTKQQLRVTALNRYLGPDNIECTGVPEQGRSGGGLFNGEGELIGVCIAADPKEQRGLYAGLEAVQDLLEEAGLSRLYRHDAVAATERASQAGHSEPERDNRSESPGAVQLVAGEPSNLPKDAGRFEPAAPQTAAVDEASADLSVLSEAQEAEVICIIRPLNSPRSASRVVIINRASPRFVSYLKGEIESQPRPTTVKRPIEIEDSSAAVKTRDAKASTIDGGGNRPAQWRPARPERGSVEPVSRVIQRYRRSPASR